MDCSTALKSVSTIPLRAMKTISHPGCKRSKCRLTASRIRRFTRLRVTAPPMRRLTEKPTRVPGRPFSRTTTTAARSDHALPSACTRLKSAGLRRRNLWGSTKPHYNQLAVDFVVLLDGQLAAPFGAACLDDLPTTARRHPRHETVHTRATTLLGLPCSLRGHIYLIPSRWVMIFPVCERRRIIPLGPWRVKSPGLCSLWWPL